MNDIIRVQIVHSFKNLTNSLRRIFLGELSTLAYSIKQFPSRSKLCDYVILVLFKSISMLIPLVGTSSIYYAPLTRTNHENGLCADVSTVVTFSIRHRPSVHFP